MKNFHYMISIASSNKNEKVITIKRKKQKNKIQLGLCCMNIHLKQQKPPIYASRKMMIRSIEKHGINKLKELIIQNLRDVLLLMKWNKEHNINVFRLSSELFPHMSNPKVESYTFDFATDLLREIGEKAKIYKQRLTFHPGQYNVVGTPNKQAFLKTVCDLKYHADVLDLMGMGKNSVIVVHGGGLYGDKNATKERWCKQFLQLPENVQKRLVIENCEKCFSIEDCLDISEKTNIPVVFDTHHYDCYKKLHPDEPMFDAEFYIPFILKTWLRRGIKPKFHVSEQGCGKIGHHSDIVNEIPNYLMEIPKKYGIKIDIMIEAKHKEIAVLKLMKKYNM